MKSIQFKSLFILLCLSVFVECTRIPEEVIPPEKMIGILADIHLTEAIVNQEQLKFKLQMDSLSGYYEYVYKKHNFTKETFRQSLTFYSKHPELLHEIYPQVIANLQKRDSIAKERLDVHIDTIQLWEGNSYYKIEKYTSNTLSFKIPAKYPNTYHISAEIKVYEDSQTKNFSPVFGFATPDTIYLFKTKKIITDTIFQKVVWQQMATDTTTTHLIGDFAPQNDSIERFKHYEIKNINIYTTEIDTLDGRSLQKAIIEQPSQAH